MHKRTVQSPHPHCFLHEALGTARLPSSLSTSRPATARVDAITDCIHCGVSTGPIPSPRLLPHLLLPRNSNQGSCHVSRLSTPHPQSRGTWQMQTEVPTVPTDPPGLLRAEPAVPS